MAKTTNTVATSNVPSPKLIAHVPQNRPTAGALLFAWTYASLQFVITCPKGKQAAVAELLHGKTAITHHGEKGTGKILCSPKGVTYDKGFFALGAANKTDPKRSKVAPDLADAMLSYIRTGKVNGPIGGWMPNSVPHAVVEISQ